MKTSQATAMASAVRSSIRQLQGELAKTAPMSNEETQLLAKLETLTRLPNTPDAFQALSGKEAAEVAAAMGQLHLVDAEGQKGLVALQQRTGGLGFDAVDQLEAKGAELADVMTTRDASPAALMAHLDALTLNEGVLQLLQFMRSPEGNDAFRSRAHPPEGTRALHVSGGLYLSEKGFVLVGQESRRLKLRSMLKADAHVDRLTTRFEKPTEASVRGVTIEQVNEGVAKLLELAKAGNIGELSYLSRTEGTYDRQEDDHLEG